MLLAFGLIIRGGYPSPELPRYGELDVERSVIYLQDHFPVSSHVLAGAPANIWAARMIYFGINSFDIPQFEDSEAFLAWMQSQDMDAVYVDQYFPTSYKDFVMSLVDNGLQEVYATPERDILIFALIERDSS